MNSIELTNYSSSLQIIDEPVGDAERECAKRLRTPLNILTA